MKTLAAAAVLLSLVSLSSRADDRKIVDHPGGVDTPVQLTLLKRDGKVGRDNAIYSGYRPQFQFSAERDQKTCAVKIPAALEKVEPGQTADVLVNCLESFKVREDGKRFVVFEGGRRVAEGRLP